MKYIESITDFLKQPNYIKNLAFAGLCLIIPIVGPMVVLGWLALGFWGRQEENPETFPDFDFGKFSLYLQRGLWPFLVLLATIIGLWIALTIVLAIPGIILGIIGGDRGFLAMIAGLVMFILNLVAWIGVMLVVKPLKIRAILAQDFARSFDFPFIKGFLKHTWKESIISAIFLAVAGMVLLPIGLIALCVGMYLAMALLFYATEHQDKQLYQLYLSRGGAPVEISPLLTEPPAPTPPPTTV